MTPIALKRIPWRTWFAFAVMLGSVLSVMLAVLAWLGGVLLSPGARFEAHDRNMTTWMGAIEKEQQEQKENSAFQLYLLCVQIRRTDPLAVPAKCSEPSVSNLAPR